MDTRAPEAGSPRFLLLRAENHLIHFLWLKTAVRALGGLSSLVKTDSQSPLDFEPGRSFTVR